MFFYIVYILFQVLQFRWSVLVCFLFQFECVFCFQGFFQMVEQGYCCYFLQLENLLIFFFLSWMLVKLRDEQGLYKVWYYLQNLKNEIYKLCFIIKYLLIKISLMGSYMWINFFLLYGVGNVFVQIYFQ